MAGAPTPRMHGATHQKGGPDPIPGLGEGGGGIEFDVTPQQGGFLEVASTGPGGVTVEALGGTGEIQLNSEAGIEMFTGVNKKFGLWARGDIDINADQGDVAIWAEGAGNGITVQSISGDATLYGGGDTYVYAEGDVRMPDLPTADPGVTNAVWADDGTLVLSGHTAGGGGGSGGPPSGPAGGVLSGTYPNPGFAQDMATQAELDAKPITGSTPTPLTGLLKGNGTDVDVAVAGTDYAIPSQLRRTVTYAQRGLFTCSAVYPADPEMVLTTPSFIADGATPLWIDVWDGSTMVGAGGRRTTFLYVDGAYVTSIHDEEGNGLMHSFSVAYRFTPAAGSHTIGLWCRLSPAGSGASKYAASTVMMIRVSTDQ